MVRGAFWIGWSQVPKFYKVFTHNLCSPIQGGKPVWNGALPFALPKVSVDTSLAECGAGWNMCLSPGTALSIAGLWPDGRPSRIFELEPTDTVYSRGLKSRTSSAIITRELTTPEIAAGVLEFSQRNLSPYADDMCRLQLLWRSSLQRPVCNKQAVATSLDNAWVGWRSKEVRNAREAQDMWKAWEGRDALAAREAQDMWTAWEARDMWKWTAWEARDAWVAWEGRAAWDAWAACIEEFALLNKWIKSPSGPSRTKIREAYANGAAVTYLVAPGCIGYIMEDSHAS